MRRLTYAAITSHPRPVTLAGREFPIPRLRPSILAEIDAWIRSQVPDPVTHARDILNGPNPLGDEAAKEIWSEALDFVEDWPPRHDSPRGHELVFETFEGRARFLFALIRRADPEFTLEDAEELVDQIDLQGDHGAFGRVIDAMGPGEIGDPKV